MRTRELSSIAPWAEVPRDEVWDMIEQARRDEREACAKIADSTPDSRGAASFIASAIRNRNK